MSDRPTDGRTNYHARTCEDASKTVILFHFMRTNVGVKEKTTLSLSVDRITLRIINQATGKPY